MTPLSDGTFSVLIRYGTKRRRRVHVDTKDPDQAAKRVAVLKKFGKEIALAKLSDPDVGARLLEHAGKGHVADARAGLAASRAAGPKLKKGEKSGPGPIVTMNDLAKAWTSGRLAREFPDHIKIKKTADHDDDRWDHLAKSIGHVPVKRFVLADAEAAMRVLPPGLTSTTRRAYAQIMSRMLQLAVYPLRLIPVTPLPRGFLPKLNGLKAKAWLYPAEDARLLACKTIALDMRVYYGLLAREGLRSGEGLSLQRRDLDLVRGAIKLDQNKTDDPRAWALDPGVTRALRLFLGTEGEPDDYPFRHLFTSSAAIRFRKHLELAGVDRAELFARSKARMPIRVHDLRATFITLSLANGKTETWVADRTGHRSSDQINGYRRGARTAEELGLGELAPLDQAIAWPDEADESGAAE
jgi:integrase